MESLRSSSRPPKCTSHLGIGLVAVMDWYSRYVVAWRLSNTLEAGFCAEALEEALGKGRPEVFNTDQSLPLRRQGGASSPAWSSPRSSRSKG